MTAALPPDNLRLRRRVGTVFSEDDPLSISSARKNFTKIFFASVVRA
jgi:hypothetical protein